MVPLSLGPLGGSVEELSRYKVLCIANFIQDITPKLLSSCFVTTPICRLLAHLQLEVILSCRSCSSFPYGGSVTWRRRVYRQYK